MSNEDDNREELEFSGVDELKKDRHVIFREYTSRYLALQAKLEFDDLSVSEFLRMFIVAYLEDDERILNFINEYKVKNDVQSKRSRKIVEKERNSVETYRANLPEDEDDSYEDIFDIIGDELDI